MPNLSMSPIMPQIMSLLQQQATLRDTNAQADLRQQQLQLTQQQQEANEKYRQALIAEETANPMLENKDTKSVGDSEVSTGTPSAKYAADVQKDMERVRRQIKIAAENQQDPKPFQSELMRLNGELRLATKDVAKEKEEQSSKVANVLRDVDSSAGLESAVNFVGENLGKSAAFNLDRQLPHDANGNLVWNDSAKKVIAPLVSQYTTNSEKARMLHDEAALKAKQLEDEEHRRHDLALERHGDAEVAARYAGINAANKRAENMMKKFGFGMDYKEFKDTQKEIDKNADSYKIRDYQKSYEVADSVEKALLDPARGFADITAAAARTLADQFKLEIDNYRSRTGGKYQESELGRMNGLLQRLDKFTSTIGEGDKILAKDVMLQTAQEMKKLAVDRNVDVVKQELKYAKSLRDRGTNPLPLTMYGDIDMLKKEINPNTKKPYAIEAKDGDKTYLLFGKEKSDKFEMPSEPDRPKFLPFETESRD